MLNIALKKLDDRSVGDADDLVHDAFLAFYEKMGELPQDTNVAGYLYTSLKNRVLNRLRKQAYHDRYLTEYHPEESASLQNPQELERLQREIQQHVAELPEQCRKVFVLNRFENYTNRQIAETMGISVNTVEQHMRRALRLLREKMDYHLFLLLMVGVGLW